MWKWSMNTSHGLTYISKTDMKPTIKTEPFWAKPKPNLFYENGSVQTVQLFEKIKPCMGVKNKTKPN